jgi:predicted DNA-binding transcriptional regulator AlpA
MPVDNLKKLRIKERDASAYIGMSVPWLRLSRSKAAKGAGPPYIKIGRAVRYDIRDLDEWLAERRIDE